MIKNWIINRMMHRLLTLLNDAGDCAHAEVIIYLSDDGRYRIGVGNPSSWCQLGEVPACYESDDYTSFSEAYEDVCDKMQEVIR